MKAKEIIISWIESGDIKRALAGMKMVSKLWGDNDLSSLISLQSGRYQLLNEQKVKGIITRSDFNVESTTIKQSLIAIINDFPDTWTNEGLEDIPSTIEERKSPLKYISTYTISLASACIILQFLNLFGGRNFLNHTLHVANSTNDIRILALFLSPYIVSLASFILLISKNRSLTSTFSILGMIISGCFVGLGILSGDYYLQILIFFSLVLLLFNFSIWRDIKRLK